MTPDWTIETVIPLALLGGAGAVVPLLLYRLHGPSLGALAVNLLASAVLLFLGGTLVFGALYLIEGADLSRRPGAAALHLARLGASAALVWLPILLLTGLVLGTRSEARLSKLREAEEARR